MCRQLLITLSAIAVASTTLVAQAGAPVGTAPRAVASIGTSPNSTVPRLLPGTRTSVFSSIQGNAVDSMNGSLANTMIRLRDARFGRIVDTVMTDKSGIFSFQGVDPGNYVVEMMSPANDAVLTASPVINVSSGQAVTALLKIPFRIPPFAGLLGNVTGSTAQAVTTAAQAVTAAAAASNTVAESLAGVPATSQNPQR